MIILLGSLVNHLVEVRKVPAERLLEHGAS